MEQRIGNCHRETKETQIEVTICLDGQGKPIEDLGNTQVFSTLPSLNGLLNEEIMVKLKAGTLSKEELIESLMGSTPLKQISKGIDVRWEDPVVPRYDI